MHHLAAFYSALVTGSAYANLAAVADQSLPVDANSNFLPQSEWSVLKTSVLGTALTAARHRSPKLQETFLPEIYPLIAGATVPDSAVLADYDGHGPALRKNDPYNIQASHSDAGTVDVFALVWLGQKVQPAPGGPINRILYTATPTLIKGQWVNYAITTTQQLPSGRYAVVGMQAQGTAHYGVRLVFTGQNQFRPGVIGQPTYPFALRDDYFGNGNFGLYGFFDNTAPPSADSLGLAAGASAVKIWLDLIKVG
jgi:hypothetical protein